MQIVHISDLHFGEELVREKVVKAIEQINKLEPDLVIFTGDVSCWGIHSEMRDAYETLLDLNPELIAVPGNHDARNDGLKFFEMYFGNRRTYRSENLKIICLNSTQPDNDDGYVGDEQRRWLSDELRSDKVCIVALHHHIVPIPNTGRERNVLIDAGEVVEVLLSSGAAVVLAGHRHMPYSVRFMRTHIIHAGALGSFKVLGMPDNNYNIIEICENELTLKLAFVDYGVVEVGKYKIKTDVPESVDIYHRMAKPKKVLFLSRRNACRTLMAEAIFNRISPNNMLAVSAGVEPVEKPDEMAVEALKEVGIKISTKPRRFREEMLRDFDIVVEFDDLGYGELWKIEKPENFEDYRRVRSEIWKRVEELVSRMLVF
ncbi:MAG: metallophosphoesterase [Archaeoglobaceae archaeon]